MACPTGKIPYPSPQAAWHSQRLHRSQYGGLIAYRCRECGSFHLGNANGRNRREAVADEREEAIFDRNR
jgi:hypothetical protein